MDDMKPNFCDYSLGDLREAWLSIDDYAFPDRAIEIYQRLKKAESETAEKHVLDNAPSWFTSVLRMFIRPPRFYETTFSDVLLEKRNAEMKEERVVKLILEKASEDNL